MGDIRDDRYNYNMSHRKRGVFLIIANGVYENYQPLPGTEKDAAELKDTFQQYGFDVRTARNRTTVEMKEDICGLAKMDHSDCDCVGIAIITYGDRDEESGQDILIGTDLNGISMAELLEPLMHVESLKKKPKLVFVEASRGEQFDDGIVCEKMRSISIDERPTSYTLAPTVIKNKRDITTKRLQLPPDFLVYNSTSSGYHSWRAEEGAVFIRILCDMLRNNLDSETDLSTLFTRVNCRIANEFESKCPERSELNGKRQMPVIKSMLTKQIVMTRKVQGRC